MQALVRVNENNPVIIKQVMDAGADGVIVPMVNSIQDAERAVASVRYPSAGSRGVGLSRAQNYGIGFTEYQEWLKNDAVITVGYTLNDSAKLSDAAGNALVDIAVEQGWDVAFPDWAEYCKDANDAMLKYGRFFTVENVLDNIVTGSTKAKLLARKYCR